MLTTEKGLSGFVSETDAISHLRNIGYTEDFSVDPELGMILSSAGKLYQPESLAIIHSVRFEGESAVEDMSVIYAIEGDDGAKGLLIDAYGPMAQPRLSDILYRMNRKWDRGDAASEPHAPRGFN